MNEYLNKLGLVDSMTIELEINRQEFVNRLSEVVDKGSTGMMADNFDIFLSSNNEFKGTVEPNGFKIKRNRKLFDTNFNFAVATGVFDSLNGKLQIETVINGFTGFMKFFYLMIISFYAIFTAIMLSSENEGSLGFIPFILLHATLMLGLPLLFMKRSVKRLKYDLEREFFYLTK